MAGKAKKANQGDGGSDWPEKIKRARTERGLTQRALAEKAGISHVTIARLETGDQIPHLSTLKKLVETLEKIPKLPEL